MWIEDPFDPKRPDPACFKKATMASTDLLKLQGSSLNIKEYDNDHNDI